MPHAYWAAWNDQRTKKKAQSFQELGFLHAAHLTRPAWPITVVQMQAQRCLQGPMLQWMG